MNELDRQFKRVWDTIEAMAAAGREAERRANARMDRAEKRMDRAEKRMDRAEARMDRFDANMDRLEKNMKGLQNLFRVGMHYLGRLEKKVDALTEAQKRTDEALRRWLESRNLTNGHTKRKIE